MNPSAYLDVRLSRNLVQSIRFVNEFGPNTEIFIGPTDEMRRYYQVQDYDQTSILGVKSSSRFYYFERHGDPRDAKVVITGVLNSSRLNHLLLQLKFAGISMDNVKIRGTFIVALEPMLRQLSNELSSFKPSPELAFIGNRSQVLIGLAKRLYPFEMASVSKEKEKESMAETLLADHQLKTVELGGGSFKFSYVVVEVNGVKKGIIAMRMPNGTLSREATRLLLEHGVKNLIMVGAGGSLDSETGVGTYQTLVSSTYDKQTIYVPSENQMQLEVPNLIAKPDRKNVTVDTPLIENDEWVKENGERDVTSVDVETFHILSAFEMFTAGRDSKDIKIFSGAFTSDVLGEHPLTDKINPHNAWKHLPDLVQSCFDYMKVPDARIMEIWTV